MTSWQADRLLLALTDSRLGPLCFSWKGSTRHLSFCESALESRRLSEPWASIRLRSMREDGSCVSAGPQHGSDESDLNRRSVVDATFTLTAREVQETRRHALLHKRSFRLALAVALLVSLSGLLLVSLRQSPGWLLLGSGLVGIVWLSLEPRRIAQKSLMRPTATQSQRFLFSDLGIEMRTDASSASAKWSLFSSWSRWKGWFVLELANSGNFVYIPRRAIGNSRDEDILLRLLREHLTAS